MAVDRQPLHKIVMSDFLKRRHVSDIGKQFYLAKLYNIIVVYRSEKCQTD